MNITSHTQANNRESEHKDLHTSKVPRLPDSQKFDFEDQRRAAGNVRRLAAFAICDARRAHQFCFSADFHFLNALSPAGDHSVQGELNTIAAVELFPVD